MHEGVLFRSGALDRVEETAQLPPVSCILNLRSIHDRRFEGIRQLSVPAIDSKSNYDVTHARAQQWLVDVMLALTYRAAFPLLIHCTAGKDRTGVVIAFTLIALGIDARIIEAEYAMSQGDLHPELFNTAVSMMPGLQAERMQDPIIADLRLRLLYSPQR